MKKTILLVAMAVGMTSVFAQDLTSKKGEKYLPESGDWSIGFDAMPILNAVGHAVSAQGGGTGVTGPMGGATIVGKMYKDETTAYRAMLGLNFGSTTLNNNVFDDQPTVVPPATKDMTKTVLDTKKSSATAITLGAGLEKRKGKTRLQGFYGAMVHLTIGSGSDTYTYGNAISKDNTTPTTTTAWGGGAPYPSGPVGTRTKEMTAGSMFGFGLNGFIGAEYFVLPKISLGAEYSWGLSFASTGDGTATMETWDAVGSTVKSVSGKVAGNSSFSIGGGYAAFTVNVHFQ